MLPLGIGAAVAFLVASPQLVAMGQQLAAGGAAVPVGSLAQNYTQFGVPLGTLFSASPRLSYYGLGHVVGSSYYNAAPKGGSSVHPAPCSARYALAGLGASSAGASAGPGRSLVSMGGRFLALGTSLAIGTTAWSASPP